MDIQLSQLITSKRNLLVDSVAGVYVPEIFAEQNGALITLTLEDGRELCDVLKAGPDSEEYWPVWEHVLDNFELSFRGSTYVLIHDNDLWLVERSIAEDWEYI